MPDWFDRLANESDAFLKSEKDKKEHVRLLVAQRTQQGPVLAKAIIGEIRTGAELFNRKFADTEFKIAEIKDGEYSISLRRARVSVEVVTHPGMINLKSKVVNALDSGNDVVEHEFAFGLDADGNLGAMKNGSKYSPGEIAELCLTPFFPGQGGPSDH
jgi:hypothetical protein